MSAIDKLIEQLEYLNRVYTSLNHPNRTMPTTIEEVRRDRSNLVRSGGLIIEFCRDEFIPHYSSSSDPVVEETGKHLKILAAKATELINTRGYFGLGMLLYSRRDENDGLSEIEMMISRLKMQRDGMKSK